MPSEDTGASVTNQRAVYRLRTKIPAPHSVEGTRTEALILPSRLHLVVLQDGHLDLLALVLNFLGSTEYGLSTERTTSH